MCCEQSCNSRTFQQVIRMGLNGTNLSGVTLVCYGLQFIEYKATDLSRYVLFATLVSNIMIGIISVMSNSLVVFVIFKDKELRTKTNQLLTLLAITDVLVGTVVIPLWLVNRINALYYIHSCVLQMIHSFFAYLLCGWSGFGVCTISIDRYVATNRCVMYRRQSYHRKKMRLLLGLWVVWLLFLPLPFSRVLGFKIFMLIVSFIMVILLGVVSVCYFKVIKKLKKNARKVIGNGVSSIPKTFTQQTSHIAVKKKTTISALVTMAFFISLCPRFIMILVLTIIGRDFDKVVVSGMCTEIFIYLNSAVNPILYIWRLPDIREAVMLTFQKIRRNTLHHAN